MAEHIDRRSFLQRTAVALGATAIVSADDLTTERTKTLSRIGLQLYTVRDAMQKDVNGTLARVAKVGYKEVEFAGYFGKKPSEISALLTETGLRAPSAHISLDDIRGRWSETLDAASAIGHDYLVCAYIGENERNPENYKKIAQEFNKAAEQARTHKIAFAYHNHDFEFVPMGEGKERVLVYDYLLRTCEPKLVRMELDLFWINKAKQDAFKYFARYPGRFQLVHVKDMGADGKFADVGTGNLPFKRYFAKARQAGIRHYFVEHDQPGDAFASIERSYQYLSKLEF
ncbi:MAG: sugar phosphate isomerase/epimerase [Gemmatimonadaceae bacterium]